jgi:hypothetical protein
MIVILILIGALFFLTGLVFGLLSVFVASRFQYYLVREHGDIVRKIVGRDTGAGGKDDAPVSSGDLWKYIKSDEDNGIREIARYKNKIKKAFLIFSIFCFIGLASLGAAFLVMVFS